MSWEDAELKELKFEEGLRLKPYQDNVHGVWTIGYGHTGKEVGPNTPEWDIEHAEDQLRADFSDALQICEDHIDCFSGLDGPRKGVLVNMAFQLGMKLTTFHQFLNLLDMGNYKEAAEDLAHTLWYKQVPNRAKRMAYRIKTGEYAQHG